MKKHIFFSSILFMAILLTGASSLPEKDREPALSVTGLVEKPQFLSMNDLSQFNSVSIKLTEVLTDRTYTGNFQYRGVPLKTLLELAVIKKLEPGFSKLIDLVIVVKNARGEKAVLTWGEVFYRNPSDTVIALSADPVKAMKSCQGCHAKGSYEKWESPLSRTIGLPKLVLANDFYSDRCIENITGIEVVDMLPQKATAKVEHLRSEAFTITGQSGESKAIENLKSYRHTAFQVKHAGEGRGYHGIEEYEGVPLMDILAENKIKPSLDSLLIFSAPDGYRSVLSYGELSMTRFGREIFIADVKDGRSIEKEGKFNLIIRHDLSSDRWVKALEKIEIIAVRPDPKLFIIGVGCGDNNLITLEALASIAKSDVFVCSNDLQVRFGTYMAGKPVLFDPLLNMPSYYRKMNSKLTEDEIKKTTDRLRVKNIGLLKEALRQGKNIGFLDYGDPTIYGSWTYWLLANFSAGEYKVIPGISAFNAANAMIAKNVAVNGSVIITVPNGIRTNEAMVKAVADKGDTLAIFVGLTELKSLVPIFNKYYRQNTPVIVVYKAGYEKSGRLIKTDISNVLGIVESDREKFLGLIYIGEALR
jgi:precorrin-4 methylase/DMSO/TMAO reductase YedYZ molybdopterin-dependent catalytic subunit